MRTIAPFSCAVVVAVISACGPEGSEPATRSMPQRDLALPAQAPAVEIASPVELRHLRAYQVARRSQRTRPTSAQRYRPVSAKLVPTVVAAAAAVTPAPLAAVPASVTEPVNDRELLPGKTVTVIPASSGPSPSTDGIDELPPSRGRTMVRGGGTCRGRGRGPGIGIAAAPRPDFR